MTKLHGFPVISPYGHLSGSVAVFCSFADRIDCGAEEVFGCLLLGSASADPIYLGWLAAALEWQEQAAVLTTFLIAGVPAETSLSSTRAPSAATPSSARSSPAASPTRMSGISTDNSSGRPAML